MLVGGGIEGCGTLIEDAGGVTEGFGGGMEFAGGTTLPAAGGVGGGDVIAGIDCGGTVGEATGVVAFTATRRLPTSEVTSSTEKLARPRGSLTSTFAPSPRVTLN